MIGYITEYQIQNIVVIHGTICDDGIYVRQEIFYNIHPFCQVRYFKVDVDDGRRRI